MIFRRPLGTTSGHLSALFPLLRLLLFLGSLGNLSSHVEVRHFVFVCLVFARLVLLFTFMMNKCQPAKAFQTENRADCTSSGQAKSMLRCGFWRHLALVLCCFLLFAFVDALALQMASIFVHLAWIFAVAVGSWACPGCTFACSAATFALSACKFISLVSIFVTLACP